MKFVQKFAWTSITLLHCRNITSSVDDPSLFNTIVIVCNQVVYIYTKLQLGKTNTKHYNKKPQPTFEH